MNRHFHLTILIILTLLLPLSINALARDAHSGHTMDMTESMPTGHSADQDKPTIRETMVDNYHLVYDLYVMPGMESSHHLMVTIHSPEGSAVENASVGYLITAPDGTKQKVMAMSMGDGYGADINLAGKGTYTISVKALFGDTDLRDSFAYEN